MPERRIVALERLAHQVTEIVQWLASLLSRQSPPSGGDFGGAGASGSVESQAQINTKAFLQVTRACEGTAGENGYRTLFGGRLFDSFADHPRVRFYEQYDGQFIKNGKLDYTTAAGAYQATETTWDAFVADEVKAGRPKPDFSPESQDLFATWLIAKNNALNDVEAGRLDAALHKCSGTWASFPYSTSGQPKRTFEFCRRAFTVAGGIVTEG